MRFEKEEKKFGKRRARTRVDRGKYMRLTIYATETDAELLSFFSVDLLNHTLVAVVSLNSLCQQDGLFALSVNRHSDILNA